MKTTPKSKQTTRKKKERRTIFPLSFARFRGSLQLFFFLFTLLFVRYYYGEILWKMQDLGFFTCSLTDLQQVSGSRINLPVYIGRFFLQFCYFPWLGSLLVTLILCLMQGLTERILRWGSSPWWYPTSFLPSAGMVVYMSLCNYNFIYEVDPSDLLIRMLASLSLLICCWLCLSVVRRVTGRKKVEVAPLTAKAAYAGWGFALAGTVLLVLFARPDANLRAMTRMQYYTQQQEWDKVIECTKGISAPTRPVAAYRSIALVNTNQLGERLFEIPYNYPELVMKNSDGTLLQNGYFYTAEACFYSGLINTAYRHLMEFLILEGPSPFTLRLMTKCAMLNQEWDLADRYLSILEKMYFQRGFTEQYRGYLAHKELIARDAELASVFDLEPVVNTFEQMYQEPLFIGYYINLTKGKSRRSLDLSLAACLYAKELEAFLVRTQALRGQSHIATHYQEAIALEGFSSGNGIEKQFPISAPVAQRTESLLREISKYMDDKQKGRDVLRKEYGNHFLYYYIFGNMVSGQQEAKETHKNGVN